MHPDLLQAAHLLFSIAGPAPEHIKMSRSGPAKYYTISHAITLEECARHLQGIKTRGATLRHPEHQTRALAFDADVTRLYPGWWWITGAAQHLAAAGYRPLLEPSPAGRGGHLWLIFEDLVDVRAARRHVCQIAPVLRDVKEYWPGPEHAPRWNKVRLPGGRYVSPDRSAWCQLYDAHGQELSRDGLAAAQVLLTSQTPVGIVPPSSPDDLRDTEANAPVRPQAHPALPAPPGASSSRTAATTDGRQQKHDAASHRFLWFHYTPRQVADWYNARHTADDLIEFDRHGMANAGLIGRPERTPSLARTPDGRHWTDFGAGALQDDGRVDGGDVLELLVRINGGRKAEILRQLGQEMVAEARAELERAAQASVLPAPWVQEIMSEAGWTRYWRLRRGQSSGA
ncbi:hypothetical protein KDH_80100 [Dictyobacter sp. S3.2.2.5]|uniref:RepB-like DNA primase domain-containing protein n=1 Tax=Dictyobacter halimunensis TaxID=3026934 RepID=A0ABQ6G8M5_9CHLR|nr:hypothetical protein KDH_80100 [Dictyobacter sp. S3.2.2.5]